MSQAQSKIQQPSMKDENITKTGSIRRAIKRGIYISENGLANERVGIAGAVFQIPPLVATLHDMLHKNQQLEMPTEHNSSQSTAPVSDTTLIPWKMQPILNRFVC